MTMAPAHQDAPWEDHCHHLQGHRSTVVVGMMETHGGGVPQGWGKETPSLLLMAAIMVQHLDRIMGVVWGSREQHHHMGWMAQYSSSSSSSGGSRMGGCHLHGAKKHHHHHLHKGLGRRSRLLVAMCSVASVDEVRSHTSAWMIGSCNVLLIKVFSPLFMRALFYPCVITQQFSKQHVVLGCRNKWPTRGWQDARQHLAHACARYHWPPNRGRRWATRRSIHCRYAGDIVHVGTQACPPHTKMTHIQTQMCRTCVAGVSWQHCHLLLRVHHHLCSLMPTTLRVGVVLLPFPGFGRQGHTFEALLQDGRTHSLLMVLCALYILFSVHVSLLHCFGETRDDAIDVVDGPS